jgi:bifunctional DNA-binding transcriptional regulator/antitoxin component of YhaV-PrlF toxin-antitoxin module
MEGKPCPFCEANEALRATGTPADKELAKNYSSRKMYVLKVIDRENEAFGPKFWRFKHDYRNSGTMDKIMAIVRAMQISIVPGMPKPLHADQSIIDKWVNDPKTWRDVYAIKSYDYLEIIVTGGEPVFDKTLNKYVAKASQEATATEENRLSSELTAGLETHKTTMMNTTSEPEVTIESENDLPF